MAIDSIAAFFSWLYAELPVSVPTSHRTCLAGMHISLFEIAPTGHCARGVKDEIKTKQANPVFSLRQVSRQQ